MRFGILGPVVVERDGVLADIKPAMPRTLLAALLLDANTAVPVEALIDALWGESLPASVTASLQNHMMRLRRLLGPELGARIRPVAPGYLIEVGPGESDLDLFNGLFASGSAAVRSWQWGRAAEDLAAALALWRGQPATDVPGLAGHPVLRQAAERRLLAAEGRVEADLELGRHRELIGELRGLAAENPLRETFQAQLMLALYRADRRAEALEAFQDLRRRPAGEPGTEPSEAVQELHGRILNADPALAAPPERDGRRSRLPADTKVFTGRERELGHLMDLIRKAPVGTDAGMVVISAIDGMGGIGKTTLAVHAAHQVRDRFPGGQLFLDLRGYTAGEESLSTEDALGRLLLAQGVPPQLIPPDLAARTAFYRDLFAGTRTLIILDNAASAAQVRPLLPGGVGCLVLITSRRRLTGLDDVGSMTLDVLLEADAIALLHKVAGPGRIPAHNPAIGELVELCGRMPLAVQIAGARLRLQSDLRIEDMVARLRDDSVRLDHLQDEDRGLAKVFDLSYQDLAEDGRHMFRRLGLVPGPDFDAYAAAELAGTDLRTAERLLETLLDHNLLVQPAAGRFRFHELIRLYARSASENDRVQGRDQAIDRLLAYYERTARMADRQLSRFTRAETTSATTRAGATDGTEPAPGPADRHEALEWMHAERENLTAAVSYAATHDRPARLIGLTAGLASILQQEGPWPQATALHQAAVAAARDHGDRPAEAAALHDLGRIRQVAADYQAALSHCERSLEIYRELGDRLGEANARWGAARVLQVSGDPATVPAYEHALAIYRDAGDRLGETNVRTDLAKIELLQGDTSAAAGLLEQSMADYHELGDPLGEANVLWELGRVRIADGDFGPAAELLQECRRVSHRAGHRLGEGSALREFGRLRVMTGPFDVAAELLEQALAIFREFGHRINEASTVWELGRLRLSMGDPPGAIELLGQALTSFQALDNRHGQACVQGDLGQALHVAGDHKAAAEELNLALAGFREIEHPRPVIETLNKIAALTADTDGPGQALPLYREALAGAREIDHRLQEAHSLEGLARCLDRLGDGEAALATLREAVAAFREVGTVEGAGAEALLADFEARDGGAPANP